MQNADFLVAELHDPFLALFRSLQLILCGLIIRLCVARGVCLELLLFDVEEIGVVLGERPEFGAAYGLLDMRQQL